MHVGLEPGHIVLDDYSAPLPQRDTAPNFRPISVLAKWLDGSRCYLVIGREVGLGPSDIVLNGYQAPPPQKGGRAPNFRPMSIAAKRLHGLRWHLAWRWALVQTTLC